MSVYDQVIKFTKQIKNEKLNKVIYFDNGNVYLIHKKDLPKKYYQKTDILFVNSPYLYLEMINKRESTQQEINQFRLVDINSIEDQTIYGEVIPRELMREHLLSLPIKDILKMRTVSKEFKDIIDNMWGDLIKRDYPMQIYDKTKCNEEYIDMYRRKNMLSVTLEILKEVSTEQNIDIKLLISFLEYNYFIRKGDTWYFYPRDILKSNIFFDNIEKLSINMNYSLEINDLQNFTPTIGMIFEYSIANKIAKIFPEGMYSRHYTSHKNTLIMNYNKFIKVYEATYGKGSFDKDFIKVMTEILETKNSKYNESPQQLLLKYHNFADGCDKQLNELIFRSKKSKRT